MRRLNIGGAAILYVALVFAAGFVFGTIRVLWIAPRWGELRAVLLELPLILLVSWLACGISIRTFGVRGRGAGLAMGAIAFALLMMAEWALARLAFNRSLAEYLRAYATVAGAAGLAGQIVFGLFPAFRSGKSQATYWSASPP
ncbi:hypothetical protein [uncultured Methylovirgula sp.]|uniref:hypothetical protein n=1 Tax=uncultured Methylovirgula sp. TaxID=1285960 RepID=UPI00262C8B21|nr:hypothetical protein [uncultured Methylovirgula sp.]